MLDMSRTPRGLLRDIANVVGAALDAAEGLGPDRVMVVGAWCRDILHSTLGHTFPTTATRDLDLALALSSWDAYRALAASFSQAGNTGIRFCIAGTDVDLLPFGSVEDPDGVVKPPSRGEELSVWAFEEIFASSLPLIITDTLSIRIPTVDGYAAAKLGAWLDRSKWHEAKDAADLALILYWYAESTLVHDTLYDTPAGNEILAAEGADLPLAAAHLLGTDVIATIGTHRRKELLARWPGNADLLTRVIGLRLRLGRGHGRPAGVVVGPGCPGGECADRGVRGGGDLVAHVGAAQGEGPAQPVGSHLGGERAAVAQVEAAQGEGGPAPGG